MKKYFYLLLTILFVFPFCVKARTLEEANELLNSFGDEITIKAVNPYDLNYYKEISNEEWYEWYNVVNGYFKLYTLKNSDSELKVIINNPECNFTDNGTKLKIDVVYENNDNEDHISKVIPVNFSNLDEKELANAKKITDEIEYFYQLGGMNSINSLYHYGYLALGEENTSLLLNRFPELLKIVEKYPEYDFEIVMDRGGSTPNWQESYAYIGVYKNNILYSYKEILFHIDDVVFVDKDKTGSLAQRAKERLENYFKGDVKISVDENIVDMIADKDIFQEDYKDINIYNMGTTEVSFDDKKFQIMIIETDSKGIDKYYVESSDEKTGVSIKTDSYDVPIDSTIKVKDVSSEDYVKKAVSDNNMKIIKVYDIDLVKYSDKKTIKDIKNGLDIYIPIENVNEGEEILVYYINNDGKIEEEISGIVVKQESNLFVKFTTNHLSTYAILEKEESTVIEQEEDKPVGDVKEETTSNNDKQTVEQLVDNPQTGDNITMYVMIFICGIIGLISSVTYYKKKIMV